MKTQIQAWATKNLLGHGQIRGIDAGNLQLSLKRKELQMKAIPGASTAESYGGVKQRSSSLAVPSGAFPVVLVRDNTIELRTKSGKPNRGVLSWRTGANGRG